MISCQVNSSLPLDGQLILFIEFSDSIKKGGDHRYLTQNDENNSRNAGGQYYGFGSAAGKKKGSTANATLVERYFLIHEESKHANSSANVPSSLVQRRLIVSYSSDCLGLRCLRLIVPKIDSGKKLPESFLGGESSLFDGLLVCSFIDYSPDSFVFRCLRLISPCKALTINCAVLSPFSFSKSTLSAISCGTRASNFFDLAFIAFVAMSVSFSNWWLTVYTKKSYKKPLTWLALDNNLVADTLMCRAIEITTPRSATNTIEASNHNVKRGNTMAMYKSTQTRLKYTEYSVQFRQFLIVGDIYPTLSHSTSNALTLIDDQGNVANHHTLKNNLPVLVKFGYSEKALAKSSVRICTLKQPSATHDAPRVFFCVCAYAYLSNTVLSRSESMVALVGQPSGWLVSDSASSANPANVTALIEICTSGGDSLILLSEIIIMMATPTQTQSKFIFLAVKRSDITAKPCRIETSAPNERTARLSLARDYVLLFAGQLPVKAVSHV